MGTQLNVATQRTAQRFTAGQLASLTPRELEVCVLHLADGWSQRTVGDWLGLSRRGVQLVVRSAVQKVPSLRPLRVQARAKPQRPRILHLSQLNTSDKGPFNADEL